MPETLYDFQWWCGLAKSRPTVMLTDYSKAQLVGVHRYRRSAKIMQHNRHMHVHIDDVNYVLVDEDENAWMQFPSWPVSSPPDGVEVREIPRLTVTQWTIGQTPQPSDR